MDLPICVTCGVQYSTDSEWVKRKECKICLDERQYVGIKGQEWTTLSKLQKSHKNIFEKSRDDNLTFFKTDPKFAIGQRAIIVPLSDGYVIWDCITLIDEETISHLKSFGKCHGIVISHPHYYDCSVEFAKALNTKVLVSRLDKEWIMRPDEIEKTIELIDDLEIQNAKVLIVGGHFDGSAVLYIPSHGGTLLTGDSIKIAVGGKNITALYSYPQMLPLGVKAFANIFNKISTLQYRTLHDGWDTISDTKTPNNPLGKTAKQIVDYSARRYIECLGENPDDHLK